jgi:hypothetical protein
MAVDCQRGTSFAIVAEAVAFAEMNALNLAGAASLLLPSTTTTVTRYSAEDSNVFRTRHPSQISGQGTISFVAVDNLPLDDGCRRRATTFG